MVAAAPEAVTAVSHVLEQALALCGRNAPLFAFLAALVESLIGVGALLPGGTAVVLAGYAVRDQGPAGLASVAVTAWLGMTLGATLDYWLGRVAGRRLVPERAPWRLARRWRRLLRTSQRFMRRWGWWAILLANLAGPGRSSIAVASGASRWSFGAFLLGQSVAAGLWSVLFCAIGYFAAGEAQRLQVALSGAGVALAAVFVALILGQALAGTIVGALARQWRTAEPAGIFRRSVVPVTQDVPATAARPPGSDGDRRP